ncbi:fimbrial isopeptide formation D2 family protein [Trueperella bonasi]|uniref:Fimbrial isopeptide formation D2 family protein n=1 Tax=Trueperella bonasi TaxID=312286 RepID=A0ABT9NGG7_9ACTO|nr:SpaH/EbpB family LPXTG-anchored major pilin [Trueperella bonasi]MDP9806498.1 fimbrial isopeptide formation D2 family protein [Trueperella bonasi]
MAVSHAKKVFALATAFVLAFIGLVFAPTSAHAQNIDTDKEGSVTVHKYDSTVTGPGTGNPSHDGQEISGLDSSKALKDVEFTIYRVDDLDLTAGDTADSKLWENISAATATPDATKATVGGTQYDLVQVGIEKTKTDGSAKFDNLPVGLYYVVETDVGPNNISKKAQPFFVSIPLPQGERGWLYDVHTYPKNVLADDGKKEVNTASNEALKVGDKIPYTITRTAPASSTDNPLTAFGVVDLSATNVTFNTDSVKVSAGGVDLDPQEFKVESEGTRDVRGETRNAYRISVIGGGLEKVAGKEVVFSYDVTVNSLIESGEVKNSFYPHTNDYDPFEANDPNNPPIDPEKTPYFGEYRFKKTDSNSGAALKDATFAVYATEDDAKNGTNPIYEGLTSGADGVVKINGLYLGEHAKEQAKGTITKTFWIAETQAPAGYKLITNEVKIDVKNGTFTDSDPIGQTVPNTKADQPDLPLTGAAGIVVLSLAGTALIGGGISLGVIASRRNRRA